MSVAPYPPVTPATTRPATTTPATTRAPATSPPASLASPDDSTDRARGLVTTPDLTVADRRTMRRSGLPWRARAKDRFWRSPVTYLVPVLVVGYGLCLFWMYSTMVPDRVLENGTEIQGLGHQAIVKANAYAMLTAVPLGLVFVMLDRFRTQTFLPRLGIWLLTFGWGACAATAFSLFLNTWMGQHLGIAGEGDPATGTRAAVFVAPFVEEFAKATVLFWIAILARYRWVSRMGAITLAGLSATGFAYVENIIYYGRAYRYAATTYGQITPEEALQYLFFVRGIASFFAHPLFTIMTVLGLAVALRTRSKTVRVLAPLAGFLGAALLHMAWNGFSSTLPDPMPLYWFVALPLVMFVVMMAIRQVGRESRLVRARLDDYVLAGWLSEPEVEAMSKPTRRLSLVWWSIFEHPVTAVTGPIALIVAPVLFVCAWQFRLPWFLEPVAVVLCLVAVAVSLLLPSRWLDTLRWLRTGTELAYLRDAMTRGLVDEAGRSREGELFGELERLRDRGVQPTVGKVRYPWVWAAETLANRKSVTQ